MMSSHKSGRIAAAAALGAVLARASAAGAAEETFFPKGTKDVMVYGAYAIPVCGDNERYAMAGVSGGYYFWDDVAVSLSVVGHVIDTTVGEDAVAGEVNLLWRKHFWQIDRWTIFGEAGAGFIYADHNLPGEGHGTNWNFTPQFGAGVTYRLKEHVHVVAGVRLFHASNAGLQGEDRHPGSNALMGYVGTMWAW